MSKIPFFAPIVEPAVRCKNCNHPHYHRHGCYFRKTTHRRPKAIRIPRCRCLSCRSTFSVLPQDLLPVMRWTLASVRRASILLKNRSAYSTAKILHVSLGAILRLAKKLPEFSQKILLLGKSRGVCEATITQDKTSEILDYPRLFPCWVSFVRELSLALYPLLHIAKTTPHEM
jgi:transposase-like protein